MSILTKEKNTLRRSFTEIRVLRKIHPDNRWFDVWISSNAMISFEKAIMGIVKPSSRSGGRFCIIFQNI